MNRRNFLKLCGLAASSLTFVMGTTGCAPYAKNVNWKEVPDSEFSLQKFNDWFYFHRLYSGINPNLKSSQISSYPGTTFKNAIGTQYQGSYITPGIDYCSNYMYAAADGIVVDVHQLKTGRLGGMIMDILHPETENPWKPGVVTRYGHLGEVKLKMGDKVKRGTQLADTIDQNAAKFMLKIAGNYANPDNYGEGQSYMKYYDEKANPKVDDAVVKILERNKIWKSVVSYSTREIGLNESMLFDKKHRQRCGSDRYDWDDFEIFSYLECLYEARPQYFPKLSPEKFVEYKSDFYANQPVILTLPLKA